MCSFSLSVMSVKYCAVLCATSTTIFFTFSILSSVLALTLFSISITDCCNRCVLFVPLSFVVAVCSVSFVFL